MAGSGPFANANHTRLSRAHRDDANRPPLLVKIAPDLDAVQLRENCRTVMELRLDGVVATNTTIAREEAGVRNDRRGGLSGHPLRRARAP